MITLNDAKAYLKIDYEDEDELISDLIKSARKLVQDVGRLTDEEVDSNDFTADIAIKFAIGYLYDNRTAPDYHKLTLNLRSLLFAQREGTM